MVTLAKSNQPANPDDLLVLLSVSRMGRFTDAAVSLGINHTTVARRITRLEEVLGGKVLERASDGWQLTNLGRQALAAAEDVERAITGLTESTHQRETLAGIVRVSATDGFSAFIISPGVAELRRSCPGIQVEVVTVTRQAQAKRSGLDIEVVVGAPDAAPGEARLLSRYELGMYAAQSYIDEYGIPNDVTDLAGHSLVYFVDSMLQVDDLAAPKRFAPQMRDSLSSTNVFVQVEATRAGAGIGFLPCFMADRHRDLIRILPRQVNEHLEYWMVMHRDAQRQPAVLAVAEAIIRSASQARNQLLPQGASQATTKRASDANEKRRVRSDRDQ